MISAPQNVRIIGECLSWSTVDCATGYDIFKDGEQVATVVDNKYMIDIAGNYSVSAFCQDQQLNKVSTERTDTIDITPDPVDKNQFLPSIVAEEYAVVFEDNFNTGHLDADKWSTKQPWGSDVITNNEAQFYIDALNPLNTNPVNPFTFTDRDTLLIEAAKAVPNDNQNAGQSFTSGVLTTFETFRFKYGYVEARFKAPEDVAGFWSAIWLYATSFSRAEIDIMELVGNEQYGALSGLWQALHSGTPSASLDPNKFTGGVISSCGGEAYNDQIGWNLPEIKAGEFNTVGCLWQENCLILFLNGKPVNSICGSDFVPSEDMYLIINLAVGGTLGGQTDIHKYPAQFEIDYVRVLQR